MMRKRIPGKIQDNNNNQQVEEAFFYFCCGVCGAGLFSKCHIMDRKKYRGTLQNDFHLQISIQLIAYAECSSSYCKLKQVHF